MACLWRELPSCDGLEKIVMYLRRAEWLEGADEGMCESERAT